MFFPSSRRGIRSLRPPSRSISFDLNAARERVANQVKLDIISNTQALENAAKLKEISRTFICESDKLPINLETETQYLADTITGF